MIVQINKQVIGLNISKCSISFCKLIILTIMCMTFLIVLNSGCSKGNDQISESSLQEEISEISETASEKPGTVETISIENADILMEKNTFPFTEKPIIPVFSVKVNGKELTKSTDYLLEYADNTRPGNQTAIIRIKGSGAYSGSREVRFSILPPVPSAVNISENGEAVNLHLLLTAADFSKASIMENVFRPGRQSECWSF